MKIIPPGHNFNTATPTIMRAEFAKLGIPADVIEALLLAAKYAKRRSPTSETFAQALVGSTTHGIWGVKNMAAGPFQYSYLKNDYEVWKGIEAAKAKKVLKQWVEAC